MCARPGGIVWPKRRFAAPRSPLRTIMGLLVSALVVAAFTGGLLVGISFLFMRYPEYASSFGWRGVNGLKDVVSLLLQEPAGWMVLAFSFLLFLSLAAFVFSPPGELVLMPDRLIIRDGRAVAELPYWQIEHIWMTRDAQGKPWLVMQGAFGRAIRLPLAPSHPLFGPTARALPYLLERLPSWTRVAPEVRNWVKERGRRRSTRL